MAVFTIARLRVFSGRRNNDGARCAAVGQR